MSSPRTLRPSHLRAAPATDRRSGLAPVVLGELLGRADIAGEKAVAELLTTIDQDPIPVRGAGFPQNGFATGVGSGAYAIFPGCDSTGLVVSALSARCP